MYIQCIFFVLKFTTEKLVNNRCFGLLLSPGRNVKDGDMHLIEMVSKNLRKFEFLKCVNFCIVILIVLRKYFKTK